MSARASTAVLTVSKRPHLLKTLARMLSAQALPPLRWLVILDSTSVPREARDRALADARAIIPQVPVSVLWPTNAMTLGALRNHAMDELARDPRVDNERLVR